MRPDGDDWVGVEIQGVYDGLSVYVYADGRIVNRWDTDDWRGSTRWQQTEDYIESRRDWLLSLPASAAAAEGDDQQRDALPERG